MEIGTGRRPPVEWPGKALICVSVTIAFEGFEYACQYASRSRGPGVVDPYSLSYADYGPKVGVWRIFDVLERNGIKATFDVGGLAAERYPNVMREMRERGHEAAGHGYSNDAYTGDDTRADELEVIRKAAKAIEDSYGERPVGWVSPGSSGTERTLEYMVQEGFLWNGDDASDDVPFVQYIDDKPLVMVPRVNHPTNDLGVWLKPMNPPSVYFEGAKDTFDVLYEEGRQGSPKWVDLLLHCHIGARPVLIAAFEKALRYTKGFEGVWFARRRDIAECILKQER